MLHEPHASSICKRTESKIRAHSRSVSTLWIPCIIVVSISVVVVGFVNYGYNAGVLKFYVIALNLLHLYHVVWGWFLFTDITNDIDLILKLRINHVGVNEEARQSKLRRRRKELLWQRNQIVSYALIILLIVLGVLLEMFFTGWMYVAPILAIQFALKWLKQLEYDWSITNISKELSLSFCKYKPCSSCDPTFAC